MQDNFKEELKDKINEMLENANDQDKQDIYDTAVGIIKSADGQDKQKMYDKIVEVLGKMVAEEYLSRPDGYWNLEKCIESAKQFQTRSDWRKGERGAHGAADRNGWLDICLPLTNDRKPRGYWTLDRCIESALEFDTSKEWREYQSSAYLVACRNGWIDICWPRTDDNEKKPPGYWTLERCIESAKQFKVRKEWSKGEAGAYDSASRNGWLNICLPLTDDKYNGRRPNGYWNLKRCTESAEQFNTRSEWAKGESGAYLSAYKNGWLNKCCVHMEDKIQIKKGNQAKKE